MESHSSRPDPPLEPESVPRSPDSSSEPVDEGRALMLAFQAGDNSAFERIIERFSERAYGLFVRFTGQREGCEDLVQDLFLRMWRARDRYQPSARFSTWMYRIAFNLAANAGERARHRKTLPLDGETPLGAGTQGSSGRLPNPGAPRPDEAMQREDVVREVQAAIASLPDNQRMALILARYEDQSHREIGEALGISAKAVKSLIHRAREALRDRLSHLIAEDLA